MERAIRDKIFDHLYEHELIVEQQHGFVRKTECVTNLLESIDLITHSLAKKHMWT
jgi:hypothetical protein